MPRTTPRRIRSATLTKRVPTSAESPNGRPRRSRAVSGQTTNGSRRTRPRRARFPATNSLRRGIERGERPTTISSERPARTADGRPALGLAGRHGLGRHDHGQRARANAELDWRRPKVSGIGPGGEGMDAPDPCECRAERADSRDVLAPAEGDRSEMTDEFQLRESLEEPDIELPVVQPRLRGDRHGRTNVRAVRNRDRQGSGPDDPVVQLDLHPSRAVTDREPDRPRNRASLAPVEPLDLAKDGRIQADRA